MLPESIADSRSLDASVSRHPAGHRQPIIYYVTNEAVWDGSSAALPPVVKIGTTIDLPKRMVSLQRQMPELRAWGLAWEPGSYDLERQRHLQFARQRLAGEWFWLVNELDDWTDRLAAGGWAL